MYVNTRKTHIHWFYMYCIQWFTALEGQKVRVDSWILITTSLSPSYETKCLFSFLLTTPGSQWIFWADFFVIVAVDCWNRSRCKYGIFTPRKTKHDKGNTTIWRCYLRKNSWFSIVMLVFECFQPGLPTFSPPKIPSFCWQKQACKEVLLTWKLVVCLRKRGNAWLAMHVLQLQACTTWSIPGIILAQPPWFFLTTCNWPSNVQLDMGTCPLGGETWPFRLV